MKKDSKNIQSTKLKVGVKQRSSKFSEPLEYKIVGDDEINLTKAEAFRFLELKTFNGERNVREAHVQFLYDEWMAGRFLWHHVILGEADLFGVKYRVNGQHTCWMRVNVPDDKEPLDAKGVRVIRYKVNSEDQLRALYSTFDRNAPRTVGHVSTVMLIDTDAANGIPHSYIRNLVTGFRLWWAGGPHWNQKANPSEITGLIKANYATLFNVVGQFFREHYEDSKTMKRAAVIGGMFATFNKAVQKSIEFWTPVLNGIGLTDRKDPRYQLREYINSVSHSVIRKGKKVTQEELYRACINSWNNWREGKLISHVQTPKDSETRPQPKA